MEQRYFGAGSVIKLIWKEGFEFGKKYGME